MAPGDAGPTATVTAHAAQARIAAQRAVPVIRAHNADDAVATAEACLDGGLAVVEVALTTPNALEAIRVLAKRGVLVGVGTVSRATEVVEAAGAGAAFAVSYCSPPGFVQTAHAHGLLAIPGAFTPNEIAAAFRAGADVVKLFPAVSAGIEFLRALRPVLPVGRVLPSGGIPLTPDAVGGWLGAGAIAVGIGSELGTARRVGRDVVAELARRVAAMVAS